MMCVVYWVSQGGQGRESRELLKVVGRGGWKRGMEGDGPMAEREKALAMQGREWEMHISYS